MSRRYWNLAVREDTTEEWRIEFGDWDRSVVDDEKFDTYNEDYYCKIFSTNGTQQDCIERMAYYNGLVAKANKGGAA